MARRPTLWPSSYHCTEANPLRRSPIRPVPSAAEPEPTVGLHRAPDRPLLDQGAAWLGCRTRVPSNRLGT